MTSTAIFTARATLAAGVVAAFGLRLLPTVRLQLAGLALLAVVLPLGAVLASGWVMFHMHDDVKILTVSATAGLSAVVGALLLARWIVGPLDLLRAAASEVARGELRAQAPEQGPAELAELGVAFNEMGRSLERLFDSRRELVAWASHDLRTPLASMQAMLEAEQDGLAGPGEYTDALHRQVRLLSSIVDDLFELARIDAGALTLDLEQASLAAIASACLRGFEAEARTRGIQLQADFDAATPSVRCAPDKVERVLFNLLTNALRHTPTDGAVAVVVRGEGGQVLVAVDDSGAGLAPGAEERMFDSFWRGDAARSADGAGLGLAIAQGLVRAHGGRIWAENRPGGGARVAFTLPV